jgi:pyruvate,water dikinase
MSEPPISALSALRAADAAGFGGKSASLGELLAAGIPVPPGFALAAAAFTEFVAAAGLERMIAEALAGAGDDVEATAAAAQRIGEAIAGAEVPPPLAAAVAAHYAQLAGGDCPVAVRSSALGEDSAEATFAGQQETILWVRGADDVIAAIRACWASLYSAEAISYRRRLGASEPAMGVTVQQMVNAAVSGVMFTCNPLSGDRSMVAINAAWGLGLAVVGGEVTPDDLLASKVTGEVVRETIADKQVQYVPAPGGRGTARIAVDEKRRRQRCLDGPAVTALIELARRVEGHFGSPQDVEWAIDGDGELFVLQSRPVTGLPERTTAPRPASAMALVMGTFGAPPPDPPEPPEQV